MDLSLINSRWNISRLLDWAGSTCVFCHAGKARHNCCDECRSRLPLILRSCHQCAVPLEYSLTGDLNNRQIYLNTYKEDDLGYLCPSCYAKPSAIDWAWSPYVYFIPLRRCLHSLKFRQVFYQSNVLGYIWRDIFCEPYAENPPLPHSMAMPDLILPMPLHKKRHTKRGYNQTLEMIRPLAKVLQLPLSHGSHALCWRKKETAEQLTLNPRERDKNLRGAFRINKNSKYYEGLQDKTVLIVDDVITTGASVNSLAACLKKAGAKKVFVWSLLRA